MVCVRGGLTLICKVISIYSNVGPAFCADEQRNIEIKLYIIRLYSLQGRHFCNHREVTSLSIFIHVRNKGGRLHFEADHQVRNQVSMS